MKELKKLLQESREGRVLFSFGPLEAIIIAIVIIALFFGGKRVGEWARGLGRFSTEFKRGKLEAEKELEELKKTTKEE